MPPLGVVGRAGSCCGTSAGSPRRSSWPRSGRVRARAPGAVGPRAATRPSARRARPSRSGSSPTGRSRAHVPRRCVGVRLARRRSSRARRRRPIATDDTVRHVVRASRAHARSSGRCRYRSRRSRCRRATPLPAWPVARRGRSARRRRSGRCSTTSRRRVERRCRHERPCCDAARCTPRGRARTRRGRWRP